jgi:integrase
VATELILPFRVVPFENASGTWSYRVTGSWKGSRTRENYGDRASADAVCNAKNAEALKASSARPVRLVQTSVPDADLNAVESAIERIAGRWRVGDVLAAGISSFEATPAPQLVAPLAEEWFLLVESELGARWFKDLKKLVTQFTKGNPGLTTDRWDSVFTRTWIDGRAVGKQTKANSRNALHRFGGWLVERGFKKENPAGGIVIRGRRSAAQIADAPMPTIFTPAQAEAMLRACELGSCRRLLGWMASCLFAGLRPESEAPRATWPEVHLKTSEWSVMGRKRGAKPRVVRLQPAALAWLRVVKADAMEKPALYSRRVRRRAVELANEWLAKHHPKERPIEWDEDVTRHTFASYRAPQIPVDDLAKEMGNSAAKIYAHYRHPQRAAAVKAFWEIRPRLR